MNDSFFRLFSMYPACLDYSVSIAGGLRYEKQEPCSFCNSWIEKECRPRYTENILNPQKKWPDTIPCHRGATAIVSERVISTLRDIKITSHKVAPVLWGPIPTNKAPDRSYFYFTPTTQIFFDVIDTQYTHPFICPICGRFDSFHFYQKYANTSIRETYQIRNSIGNEEEIALAIVGGSDCVICVTEKIVELCRVSKWSNFSFHTLFNDELEIHHTLPNWRELLEQDIAREEARLRGEDPDPIQISVPAMLPRKSSPKPISGHPFDNLSEFDGTAWQGTDSLPWAFGLYVFIVYEDENAESAIENEDDDLPTAGQRTLFDYFRSIQEALLPQLYDVLMKGLQKIGVLFTARIAFYADLAQVLDSGDLEIRNTSPQGKGILSLAYATKDKKHDLIVRIACTPSRKSFRVLPCRVDE